MHGTFNGLPLKRIIAVKTSTDAPGFTRTTFRVLGGANRKLEERLHLGDEATLILSSIGDVFSREHRRPCAMVIAVELARG